MSYQLFHDALRHSRDQAQYDRILRSLRYALSAIPDDEYEQLIRVRPLFMDKPLYERVMTESRRKKWSYITNTFTFWARWLLVLALCWLALQLFFIGSIVSMVLVTGAALYLMLPKPRMHKG